MAEINRDNPAVQGLLGLLRITTGRINPRTNKVDDEVTRGEVRRYLSDRFDTNRNNVIDQAESELINQMTTINLDVVRGLAPSELQRLRRAQELLRSVARERLVPPKPIRGTEHEHAPLIVDPHELSDEATMTRWSDMRRGFTGQTVQINVREGVDRIQQILNANGGNVDKLVEQLWSNEDNISGINSKVIRMEELIGAFKYAETLPQDQKEKFLQDFYKAMGNYLNKDRSLDPQFVLDSLLHVIQSTDFTGQDKLKEFLQGIVKGIVNNTDAFKNQTGVVGNYDGTREGGVFGSLAVVRKEDGSIEFIEHDPSDPGKKTKYQLIEGGVPRPAGAGGGFAPAGPGGPQAPAGPGAPAGPQAPGGPGGPQAPGQPALKNKFVDFDKEINNVYEAVDEVQRNGFGPDLQTELDNLHGVSRDFTGIIRGLDAGTNPTPQALRQLAQRIRAIATSLGQKSDDPQISQQIQRLNGVADQLETLARSLETQGAQGAGTFQPTPLDSIRVDTSKLQPHQLRHYKAHILPHFGYDVAKPDTDAVNVNAWKKYAQEIEKKLGVPLSQLIQDAQTLTEDQFKNRYNTRQKLSHPHEAYVALRSGLFSVTVAQPQPAPAQQQPPAGQPPAAQPAPAPAQQQPPAAQPPAGQSPAAQPPAAQPPGGFAGGIGAPPPAAQPPAGQPPAAQPAPAQQQPPAGQPAAQPAPAQQPPPAAQPPAGQPPAATSPATPRRTVRLDQRYLWKLVIPEKYAGPGEQREVIFSIDYYGNLTNRGGEEGVVSNYRHIAPLLEEAGIKVRPVLNPNTGAVRYVEIDFYKEGEFQILRRNPRGMIPVSESQSGQTVPDPNGTRAYLDSGGPIVVG